MNESTKQKLDTVLKEYDNIRAEIRDTFRLHVQVFAIVVSAFTLILAYAFANGVYEILLAIPALTIALFWRWLWDQDSIMALGYYQEAVIERNKIPFLVGFVDGFNDKKPEAQKGGEVDFERYWIGWQSYWRHQRAELRKKGFPPAHIYAVMGVFIVLPIVGSLAYSVAWLLLGLSSGRVSLVSISAILSINLIYIVASVYLCIKPYMTLNKYFDEKYKRLDSGNI
jgi:hypothetical protein